MTDIVLDVCPTCSQRMPARPVRICTACGVAIIRGHKWQFFRKGGLVTLRHRHCDNPSSYFPRDVWERFVALRDQGRRQEAGRVLADYRERESAS